MFVSIHREDAQKAKEAVSEEAQELLGAPMILQLVEFLQDYVKQNRTLNYKKDKERVLESTEVLVVKIDHMRNHTAYIKTLQSWSESVNLKSLLVISKDKGLNFISTGRQEFPGLYITYPINLFRFFENF